MSGMYTSMLCAIKGIRCNVLQATPNVGQRLVEGSLRFRGLSVQRHCIEEAIRGVDPVVSTLRATQQIIRRVYCVPCPNAL